MRRLNAVSPQLQQLMTRASARPLTSVDRERQLVSFAYGNVRLEDATVTRELVEDAARISPKK